MKPRKSTPFRPNPLAAALAIVVTLTAAVAFAGETWDGGAGSGLWSAPTNWTPDGLPGTGALTFTGSVQTSTNNDLAVDRSYGGINFTNTTGNPFTLAGARITLGGNITTTANTAGTTITDSISLPMILSGNRTITTSQQSATVQHNLTISGMISADVVGRTLTKAGSGVLTLSGSNTYTGLTTVTGGGTLRLAGDNIAMTGGVRLNGATAGTRLDINSNTAIGTGTFTISDGGNGTIGNSSGVARTLTTNNPQTWNQNFTVSLSNSLNMGTGAVTLGGNRTITTGGGTGTWTVGGVISGAFGITITNGGSTVIYFTGANTFTGEVNILDGTLRVNSLSDANVAGPLGKQSTAANQVIQLGNSSGEIGVLLFQGASANASTDRKFQIGGNTTGTSGGTITNNDPTYTVTFTNADFNIATNGSSSFSRTLTLNGSNTGDNTIQGNILETLSRINVTKSGTGTWVLAGASTAASYEGATTINAGVLKMGIANALPSGTGKAAVNVNGGATASAAGTLNLNGFDQAINGLGGTTGVVLGKIVNNATGTNKTLTVGNNNASDTFNGIIADNTSGTGIVALMKVGTGIQTLTGPNTYSGGTTVSNGPLVFLNTTAKSASGTHTFAAGATLGLGVSGASAFTATDITNAFAGTMTDNLSGITVDAATAIGIDTTNGAFSYSDSVTGSPTRGLTKLGIDTLTLSGSNTYTGATIVRGGTLALGASDVLPDSGVSIGAATLQVGATFTDSTGILDITGPAVINLGDGTSQIAFLDSSASDWTGGTLNITGTFTPGSSLRFGTTSGGLLPAQLALISVNGLGAGTYSLNSGGYLDVGGYSSWAALNGAGANREDDHDFDGVQNGVEFFMGGPAGYTTGFTPLPGVTPGTTLSVTWIKGAGYDGDYITDFVVETSATLEAGSWVPVSPSGTAGTPDTVYLLDGNNVTYTFPAETVKFARLKVTGP